jgi:hypothetical protein
MDQADGGARRRQLVLGAVAVAIVAGIAVLPIAEPAFAASDVGKNLGKEIETWGKAIMLAVVGLVAIPVLAKRDVAGGAVLAMLAIVVGGFVFAPGSVREVIAGLWRSIGG